MEARKCVLRASPVRLVATGAIRPTPKDAKRTSGPETSETAHEITAFQRLL